MSEKNELTDNELIKKLSTFNKEAWDNFNYSDGTYSKEQERIIQREKNKFFVKYYQDHPECENMGEQPQEEQMQDEYLSPEAQSAVDQRVAELQARQAEYMAKENPSFIMYHSFYEQLEDLHGNEFEDHIRALCECGLYKKKGDYEGSVKMYMRGVIPQLEANEIKKIKKTLSGLKGGAPKGNQNAKK